MWATIEQIINNKMYLIKDDQTRMVMEMPENVNLKENNYIKIVDGKIVEIKEYNEELYKQIKELQNKLFTKKN